MDENKIRRIAQEEIQNMDARGRFTVKSIPNHTHNGIDSLPIVQPILTYIGIISPGFQSFLPNGWSYETSGTGVYTIRTNLPIGTVFTVTATSETVAVIPTVINAIVLAIDEIQFEIVNVITQSYIDAKFYFTVTVINNRSTTLPSYTATNL